MQTGQDVLKGVISSIDGVIDLISTTRIKGRVKVTPANLKEAIKLALERHQKITGPIQKYEDEVTRLGFEVIRLGAKAQGYETEISGLVDEVIGYKAQVEQLRTDLTQEQELYDSVLRVYGPVIAGIAESLKPIVDTLPDDIADSLLSKLYELGEDNPLLPALESRAYELEQKSLKEAEAEDEAEYLVDDGVSLLEIGKVVKYYPRLGVAGIKLNEGLEEPLNKGDQIYINGPEEGLEQAADSIELNHGKITKAVAGTTIALKVEAEVSEGATVSRMYRL